MKVGRNDQCPCGSGRKFKKCCLNMPDLSTLVQQTKAQSTLPPEVLADIAGHTRSEQARVSRFGKIRPIIQVPNYAGYRFVAVNRTLYYSKKWKFFADFLLEYGLIRLGSEWRDTQKLLKLEVQHPVWVWHSQSHLFLRSQPPVGEGIYAAIPNGAVSACLHFYYDLYTVDDNGILDDSLLARLRHRDQFQGAHHELFVQASCLRAGFTIIRENEQDPSRKHVEFVAVHKATGQHILVEAKSRHRPGVMAQPGQQKTIPDLRFLGLINDAAAKDSSNPLAIFVDTNLPPESASRFYEPDSNSPHRVPKAIASIIEQLEKSNAGIAPYNLLVFSNHPHHYAKDDSPAPANQAVCIVSHSPRVPVYRSEVLIDLVRSVDLYNNIPNEFPESKFKQS
ncbi:MAG: SEC-C domain-containing protein [Bryobacterales bacterium]|nr:SEC-C domain-containing protein [Bryobacterales bacterium]